MKCVSTSLRKRDGYSLIEVLIAVGVLSMAIVVTTLLLTTSLRMWATGSSGTAANSYVALAMRKLVLDIEEGRTAVLQNVATDSSGVQYGTQLQITFPYLGSGANDYSKTQTGAVATYYLSGVTGSETTGTYLWKSVGTTKTRLARNIKLQSLEFRVTNGKLISIHITGFDLEGTANGEDTIIQQSVKLRNS